MKAKFTTPKLRKLLNIGIFYRYEGKQFRETSGLNKIENEKERNYAIRNYV
jgi:hypothetical protein